mgnify:CR=1 FL=1
MVTTSTNYNVYSNIGTTSKILETICKKSDIKSMCSKYWVNAHNITDFDKLKELGLTEKEIKTIKWLVQQAFWQSDVKFDFSIAPDFIRAIIKKYGITDENMKNKNVLLELVTDEAELESIINYRDWLLEINNK